MYIIINWDPYYQWLYDYSYWSVITLVVGLYGLQIKHVVSTGPTYHQLWEIPLYDENDLSHVYYPQIQVYYPDCQVYYPKVKFIIPVDNILYIINHAT